ncbi:MAG TPA: glutamine--fructose-6-phosphate transaminase (isomerizing) [Methylophilaceae bacterium]|jgi:glucosamine--fructose-6-phosphate aminotransferase (isomerizing)|nr:glutamine--fructose-6-phosphate transaminase (isomerizing) [Methylophilaceae bacterium]
MCGIVGALAQRNIVPLLLEGLSRLEYRGYDSAGLLVLDPAGFQRVRTVGRVAELRSRSDALKGEAGIAHTRWATHGVPSERNAHPHISRERIAVVHNGIIENHEDLRRELISEGYAFDSDTDTEVIAHLVHRSLSGHGSLLEATRDALARVKGAYAICVAAAHDPHRLVCARRGSPLLIGIGKGEHYVASDASALLTITNRIVHLEEGDVAELTRYGYRIWNEGGKPVERQARKSSLRHENVELGQYSHYMQKEIFEQPQALEETLESLCGKSQLKSSIFGEHAPAALSEINRVLILACGTSYHAGLVARYWLEDIAGIPCDVEIASEYRYRASVPNPRTLVIAISQSGETADTLAALQHAAAQGMRHALAICNVDESSLTRHARLKLLTRAGPEIGVASTKAFTTQLAGLFILTLILAQEFGRLEIERERILFREIRKLPTLVRNVLELEPAIAQLATRFADKKHALFLGRGLHYPIAMEGALKLKEISYIHAEAYPAGELKHGPLALVDSEMPVISVAPNDALLEKLKSNLQEVSARGGELYVFADADARITHAENIHVIRLPGNAGYLSPILHTIPLQLLAYHVALLKGTDVDKPRNLAKSVTVE